MKKILGFAAALITLLCGGCTNDDEVRVMPEFNYSDHTVTLSRAEGSSFTALIATTESVVHAEFDCEWLAVDVNTRRAVFTATQTNEGSETRTTQVTLRAGEFVEQVTVNQSAVDEEGGLKVGDPTDDGLGMIFWVDPSNRSIGKAVSLARLEGKPFELTMKAHGAESRVDGLANTALYTEHTAEEAAGYCTAMGEGWYLPAVNELNELFDAYNGIGHEDPSFVAATIETLTDPEKMARAAFDKMLTDLGGTVIDATTSGNGQSYWSSTEYDDQNVYGVRVGKYLQDKWKKSGTARFVRCVRRVGNYLPPEEPATLTLSAQTLALEAAAGSTASVTATTNKELTTLAVTLADASWLAFEIADATITFRALSDNETGNARSTTATVTAGSGDNTASVTLTVSQAKLITVDPWQVGDIVPDADGLKGGIVFWVDPADGTRAKIVSLDRSEKIVGERTMSGSTSRMPTVPSIQPKLQSTNEQPLALHWHGAPPAVRGGICPRKTSLQTCSTSTTVATAATALPIQNQPKSAMPKKSNVIKSKNSSSTQEVIRSMERPKPAVLKPQLAQTEMETATGLRTKRV